LRDQSGFIKKLPAYRAFSATHSLMITRILQTYFFMLLLPAKHTAASLCQERLVYSLKATLSATKSCVYKKTSCVQDIFGNAFILWGKRATQRFLHMVTGQFTKGILRKYLVQIFSGTFPNIFTFLVCGLS